MLAHSRRDRVSMWQNAIQVSLGETLLGFTRRLGHTWGMSATAPKTIPPQAETSTRDLDAEQRALTMALTAHADPHVRLLAHISERQMAFVEQMNDFKKTVSVGLDACAKSIEDLTTAVRETRARQDEHERKYPLSNGDAVHADAQ